MSDSRRLLVLPSLKAVAKDDGRVVVTQKFVDGMTEYVNSWDGPVRAVLEPADATSNNLDNVAVVPAALPFELEVVSFRDPRINDHLRESAVALGGTDHRQNHFATLCANLGTPYVVNTEYTLQTRCQIATAEESNPLRRWRRIWWERGQERANVTSVRRAAGVQCNGMPTYDAYRTLNAATLLYFDTRTTAELLPDEEQLQLRLAQMLQGAPLRLAFSGRLIAMKGADHLSRVAVELRRLQVPFTLTICGDGDLRPRLQREIELAGLQDVVKLPGTLDFVTQLTPLLQDEIDLFVCPHRQGDPSCTYLETMACGVPIVGYANEAWAGLLRHGASGWSTPLDDPRALARQVAQLTQDRESIARAACQVREFAAEHTFERVFQRRIEQLLAIAETPELASV